MDGILHIIYAVAFFGLRWGVVLGSILPDVLYYVATIKAKLNIRIARQSRIFRIGERMHSIFVLPLIFLTVYCILKVEAILYLVASIYLHLLLDMITHKDSGPRFLWPLLDRYYPRGLGQWEDLKVSCTAYMIGVALLVMRYATP